MEKPNEVSQTASLFKEFGIKPTVTRRGDKYTILCGENFIKAINEALDRIPKNEKVILLKRRKP